MIFCFSTISKSTNFIMQRILLLVSLAFNCLILNAQDISFSQFYLNSIYLNPAFAGNSGAPRLTMSYRNQWPALNKAFITYSASVDFRIKNTNSNLGFLIVNDSQADGALQETRSNLIFAHGVNLNRKYFLKFGFQAGFVQTAVDRTKLIFPSMIDPLVGINMNNSEIQDAYSRNFIDFSVGIACFSKKLYFGASFHHIAKLGISSEFDKYEFLPEKLSLHFGTTIEVKNTGLHKESNTISPNIIIEKHGDFVFMNYGAHYKYKIMKIGIYNRHNIKLHYDSVILHILFNYSNIEIAYSYDFTISGLLNSTNGAHELGLRLKFGDELKLRKSKAISCPSF